MTTVRTIVIALVMVMASTMAKAQQTADESNIKQKFVRWFSIMAKNRSSYNRYNDSIFLIHDHDRWVKFFYNRAHNNHIIYNSNKQCLDSIKAAVMNPRFKGNSTVLKDFFNALFNQYIKNKRTDPFILLEMCDYVDTLQTGVPDSLKYTNYLSAWRGGAYYQIWNITNKNEHLKKAYNYFNLCIKPEAKRYRNFEGYYRASMYTLCTHIYAQNHIETVADLRRRIREFRLYMNRNKEVFAKNKQDVDYIYKRLDTADENLIRNIYMVDTTSLKKKTALRMMRKIVAANLRNPNLSDFSYLRTMLMQIKLGQTTPKDALRNFRPRYMKAMAEMQNKRFTSNEFVQHLAPYNTLFYLNDIADMPYSKKRKNVIMMCHDIERAFQHRSDQQTVTYFVKSLNTYVTYERITKYLKPKERIAFLTNLSVSTNVTTYAHSVHVSEIAQAITQSIVDYQPQLLVGYLGCKTTNSVKRHKKEIVEFMREAAIYHDLGKNTIIPIVDNDYRPVTDMEFGIIKQHPEMGLKYLKLDPRLEKYHDTTLGHHKWYNGKGGYPKNFDNIQSPYRMLIDIITLSDCMQAATEHVGRNYKGEKNFDTVMAEFRRDAGTRYNPDLVKHIDANPQLALQLNDLLDDGWVEIYYNIYSQYFVKGGSKN